MKLHLIPQSQKHNSPCLVLFLSQKASQKDVAPDLSHLPLDLQTRFKDAVRDKSLTGKAQETVLFREIQFDGYRHVLVVGLGLDSELSPETLRQSAAAALGVVKNLKTPKVHMDFESVGASALKAVPYLQAFAEGLLLADYSFDELKTKDASSEKELDCGILANTTDKALKEALFRAEGLVSSVNFSRRMGDLPGNLLTPTILAKETVNAAKGLAHLKVTVWNRERIKKEKMGGLLGVSQGSDQEPKFIIMEYSGAPKSQKPVVLVGKGLTFDCGGVSIKPSASMEEMKYDMCGGANVIGAVLAIAKLKLKINVVGLVPSTENVIGPSATKPGDVHTARNGKTFEVNNTDAEGRLILADALCYACELKPKAIIDAATLTGAMVIALGNLYTGYFTKNKDLKNKIEDSAAVTGELVWNMPLHEQHAKDMKGVFADLSNISASKGAGSATAAAFLEQFVEKDIPWAHFDIAGTAWAVGGRLNYCSKKGASGVMVRTFVELAQKLASTGN